MQYGLIALPDCCIVPTYISYHSTASDYFKKIVFSHLEPYFSKQSCFKTIASFLLILHLQIRFFQSRSPLCIAYMSFIHVSNRIVQKKKTKLSFCYSLSRN